jgi:hypothetical protein
MLFMIASKSGTYSINQFLGGQHPIWFHHPSLAMYPLGLDRIQLRALDWQQADKDANALSVLSDLAVALPNPGAYGLAMACLPLSKRTASVGRSDSTRSHLHSPRPNPDDC